LQLAGDARGFATCASSVTRDACGTTLGKRERQGRSLCGIPCARCNLAFVSGTASGYLVSWTGRKVAAYKDDEFLGEAAGDEDEAAPANAVALALAGAPLAAPPFAAQANPPPQ
jgi:hypothetical protein